MKSKSICKLPILLFLTLACLAFGQKTKPDPQDKIVFGRTYTLEELKKTSGFIRCASSEYEAMLQKQDPRRMTDKKFENWIAPLIANAQFNRSQNGGIITIPVVVHVIHGGEALGTAPNITDAQVESQITVMNNDFRRLSGTPGHNTSPVGTDTMIQFALAKVDPNGNPTNGIDRVNLCSPSWSDIDTDRYVKPTTIWDPTRYMNMWSVNFTDTDLLGYAQFPSASNLPGLAAVGGYADTDGVVANYATFGSIDYNDGTFMLNAPYNRGRTMTHEVGHFLGLRHIWGDRSCGDDFCADTPVHETSNGGCPTHPKSNTCGTSDEMFENYMDYTYDSCMNIFTINQSERITAVMNNSPRRMELRTSTADLPVPLFANDAELKGERNCNQQTCSSPAITARFSLYNRGTSPLTSAVITYSVNGGAQQTTNWSGNLDQDKYAVIDIPTGSGSGIINAQITSVNGTADQRNTNNSASVALENSVPASASNPGFILELQLDYFGSETTWTLINSAGTTVYSGGPYPNVVNPGPNPIPAPLSINWTLPVNDCYTFTINDSEGDGIYRYGGFYRIKNATGNIITLGDATFASTQSRQFRVVGTLATHETTKTKNTAGIYPNPVGDVLNVTNLADKTKYEIHNTAGQLIKTGSVEDQKVHVAELTKGVYFITFKNEKQQNNIKFIKK
ncbi:MAG: T9SS type A sorting domain-containing protein [Chryseobacterium sp.]|jgi:hypothetical protein|uniref:M43 family zinc metalloprotease n=1 Tax=Chryseobacterium sp. TaxID=1871047 RepID=UPI00282A9170|nr:M43 family zinc metalloprotease [Chryseobacterium sp.]MDR2235399.1 T9SS type A sorting domain-containing protein [Chryseobacterium sp.]